MSTNPSSPRIQKIKQAYEAFLTDPRLMTLQAIEGVGIQTVQDVMMLSGQKKETLADLLEISPKTLSNYEREGKILSASQSEALLKMISLYLDGILVFGSSDAFNIWLTKPSYGLRGDVPMDLMFTSGGISLVHDEVSRIAHGDLA